jgi:hypothetical protein
MIDSRTMIPIFYYVTHVNVNLPSARELVNGTKALIGDVGCFKSMLFSDAESCVNSTRSTLHSMAKTVKSVSHEDLSVFFLSKQDALHEDESSDWVENEVTRVFLLDESGEINEDSWIAMCRIYYEDSMVEFVDSASKSVQ